MRVGYHGRNLRKGRVSEPGRPYRVTAVTFDRNPVFGSLYAGRFLVTEMRAVADAGLAESLAWVVMPDHVHWLLSLKRGELSRLVQRVKSRTAIAIHKELGFAERVWQKGYHDHAVRAEEDLQALARYVVANPLRAGLVHAVGDYSLWDAVWL